MRPDRLFLLDIVQAADAITVHIAGRERDTFLADPTARAAVLHKLTVIGEAAGRVSQTTLRQRPGLEELVQRTAGVWRRGDGLRYQKKLRREW